jgi:hypothetical protein
MQYLTIDIVRTSCVFVLKITEPTDTLRRLALFFIENRVLIYQLNLHRNQDGTATVVVHCLIRKGLVDETSVMLGQLPGINGLELLEERRPISS